MTTNETENHPCFTGGNCAGGWPIVEGLCTFCGGTVKGEDK